MFSIMLDTDFKSEPFSHLNKSDVISTRYLTYSHYWFFLIIIVGQEKPLMTMYI